MKQAFLTVSLAALLAQAGPAAAQGHQNPPPASAAEIAGVPAGTVITKAFAEALARDVYVWSWPIVNAFHRRASFAAAPEPGLPGGVLPVAPTGYVGMLHGYISPDQRWVAHPNQDVVYGFGYGAVDTDPVVMQVPDFGDRFWVYAVYDARSDEFSNLGKQYGTKPGNYLIVGPNWKGTVPEGITGVLHAPTDLIAMGPRIFMDDTDKDRAAIQEVLNQVVVYPLSEYDGKPKTKVWAEVPHFERTESSASAGGTAAETSWVNPKTFFDELPGILDQVPPLPGEEARYAMIDALLAAAADHASGRRDRDDHHLAALRLPHQRPAPAGRLEFAAERRRLGLRLPDARGDGEVEHVRQSTDGDALLLRRGG